MAEAMVKKEAMAPPPAKIRKKNTAVCCPLVYGSVAFWLGRKADEYHTHKWTLFVRGPHGEDLGYFVEKVVFKLHPSFAQPVREIHEPPYEVTEKGWGEFEASVRVHFRDPSERPVEFSHVVKLYDGTTPQVATQPVVSEVYDEVVFTEPHEALYDRAMARSGPPPAGHPLNENFSRFDDAPEMETLLRAGEYVRGQLHSVKDAIARLDHQIGLARQMEQSRQAQEQHAAQQAQQQAQQRQESRASSRKPASPRRAADAPPDAAAPPPKPAAAPPPAAS
jgi:YEATS domain-containing protein 4